jgi:hypothetical protein
VLDQEDTYQAFGSLLGLTRARRAS